MKAQWSKTMGCNKSSSKKEICSNTILPQETRKTSHKQPNLIPKTTRETKPKVSRRKEILKIRAEVNERETKQLQGSMKLKAGSLKRETGLINLQPDSSRKKRESTQISKTRNKKEVTTDSTEIPRIIRDYCEQLYVHKMDNLEEMEKFLERYSLPRLPQEEIENISRPITNTEI